MQYFGFIYIWFDTIKRKFCVGSHYGKIDDGYVTSTGYMMRAYKKRPETFKRKILEYVLTDDKVEIFKQEQKWLDKIKDEELTTKYYNFKKAAAGGNGKANLGNSKCGGWNKGATKEMLTLRKEGKFKLLCDKPKNVPLKTWSQESKSRQSELMKRRHASGSMPQPWNLGLSAQNDERLALYGKKVSESKIGGTAWNKGKPSPHSGGNGKSSAAKQSKTVTGRRKHLKEDGTFIWKYPREDGSWYIKENGEQVPVF